MLSIITAGEFVTATDAVPVHPLISVAVTIYVVFTDGLAFTVLPVVAESPAAGDHEYEIPPPAVNATGEPGLQYVAEPGLTETEGALFVVTSKLEEQVCPQLSETVTEYVCEPTFAVTLDVLPPNATPSSFQLYK